MKRQKPSLVGNRPKRRDFPGKMDFRWVRICLLAFLLVGCTLSGPLPVPTPLSTRSLPSPVALSYTSTPSPTLRPAPTLTHTPTATSTPYPPVQVETVSLRSKFMGGMERVASVYLPGAYAANPAARFKVLYAFDGQELPTIAFEQYLNTLYSSRQVEPVIVVAIVSLDGEMRKEELAAGPYINLFGWGTLADSFNKFLVSELVPLINSQYRTQTGPANTAVMGWSLGGLAAVYNGWKNSGTFGIVGAFSPSLWWRTESKPGYELQARVMHQLVRSEAKRAGLRMWFEAGTAEEPFSDIDKNGVSDVIQDVQDLLDLLRQKGYQDGADLAYVQVDGGQHDITTWAKVLPNFLHWAFPYQGS